MLVGWHSSLWSYLSSLLWQETYHQRLLNPLMQGHIETQLNPSSGLVLSSPKVALSGTTPTLPKDLPLPLPLGGTGYTYWGSDQQRC